MFSLHDISKKRGAALVGVILTMVILSMLVVALLGISLSESKHAIKSQSNVQALYNAKSAGLAAANYLIVNQNSAAVSGIYSLSEQQLYNGSYENGTATVVVRPDNSDTMTVYSQWTGSSSTGKVNIRLQKNTPPWMAGKYGIQAKTTIMVDGTSYDVQSNLAAYDTNVVLDSPFLFTDADTLDPEEYLLSFPQIGTWNPPVGEIVYVLEPVSTSTVIDNSTLDKNYVSINGSVDLSGNGKNLTIKSNKEIFIQVNGDFTLTGQGNTTALVLEGSGPVHFLINGSLNLGANCVNELGEEIGPENFIFYVPYSSSDARTVTLSGTSEIRATIVAPDLLMQTSGTPTFSGISWVHSFYGNGNITYIQDPVPTDNFDDGFFRWPLQITGYSD